ncbi:MAG: hypothetical protein JO256_07075, partial [Alphaproteobacteria bacterium]|nr:hypothetical protein [Alphaproteobacteria bacterium]
MKILLPLLALSFIAPALLPAAAQELSGPCPVGKMVSDRQGKTGKVVDTDAVGCHVQLPNGEKTYYLSWMLHLAGTPVQTAAETAAIPRKKYSCYGSGHYLFMDITIKDAGNYTDVEGKPGKYRYDPKTQAITFLSGSFQGSYGKYL